MSNLLEQNLSRLHNTPDKEMNALDHYEKAILESLHTLRRVSNSREKKWLPDYDDLEDFENMQAALKRVSWLIEQEKDQHYPNR